MVIGYTKAILWSDRLRHNIMTESAIQVFTDSFPSLQRTQTILVLCHNQMCKKYHYCKFLKKFGIDAEVKAPDSFMFIMNHLSFNEPDQP